MMGGGSPALSMVSPRRKPHDDDQGAVEIPTMKIVDDLDVTGDDEPQQEVVASGLSQPASDDL
jgi:hypothetical protein